MYRNRAATTGTALAALVTLATVAGCSPSPPPPGEGELTGVIVSGGGSWLTLSETPGQTVVLLDPQQYAQLYTADSPERPVPATESDLGSEGWLLREQDVHRDPEAGTWPLQVQVSDGRFRVPWDGRDALLCFGRTAPGDAAADIALTGCQSVPDKPPLAVRVYVERTVQMRAVDP